MCPLLGCYAGWDLYKGMCYFKGIELLTWTEAGDDCKARGGALATVNSQDKQVRTLV